MEVDAAAFRNTTGQLLDYADISWVFFTDWSY